MSIVISIYLRWYFLDAERTGAAAGGGAGRELSTSGMLPYLRQIAALSVETEDGEEKTHAHEVLDGSIWVVEAGLHCAHDLIPLEAHFRHRRDGRLQSGSGDCAQSVKSSRAWQVKD